MRHPEASAYDVLGLSPDSRPEEVEEAFHRLIDEGGYRVGVPLHQQWQKARRIKDAYATLRESAGRSESSRGASDQPLWPAATEPRAEDLLRPAETRQPAAPPIEDILILDASMTAPPAPAVAAAAAQPQEDVGEAMPQPWEETRSRFIQADDELAAAPEDGFAADETRHATRSGYAAAAVATLALGSLLYLSWPTRQTPAAEPATQAPNHVTNRTQQPTQVALPQPGGALAPGQEQSGTQMPPAPTPTAADAAPTSVPVSDLPQAALPSPAAEAQGQPSPPVPSPTPVPPTSQQVAAAPSALPQAAPAAGVAVTQAPAPSIAAARPSPGALQVPAVWLGGGPSNADNRGGWYEGTVAVRFTIQPNGRVSNCVATRGSGNANLDAMTCGLVETGMRFRPALDQGRPVASQGSATYVWRRSHHHWLKIRL